MHDQPNSGISVLSVRRRRIRSLTDGTPRNTGRSTGHAHDLLPELPGPLAVVFEPDRSWCRPSAGEVVRARRTDTLWGLLDRWARGGAATVRTGSPDVYRVLRLPAETVRSSLEQWPGQTLVAGKSTLTVESAGTSSLRGNFKPHRAARSAVEIRFEHWSQRHLCAHLVPTGRRAGSLAWWSAAHAVLDEFAERLEQSDIDSSLTR